MKSFIYILFIGLLTSACQQNKPTNPNLVALSIEQNGTNIQPKNGTVFLDKAPFNLVFKFSTPNYILVNASHSKDLMFKALNNEDLVSQPQFTLGNIIAETYFNADKSIYTSDVSSSAWLQESMDKHMFNSLRLNNGTYTATRLVENSFDLDQNYNIQIQDINQPLYLVFVVIDKNSDLKNNVELQRLTVKIDWTIQAEDAQDVTLLNRFSQLTDAIPLKQIPLSDDTNFNNTALTEVLTKEDANILQLGKIYPNFFTAGYSFKVSPAYRLQLFDNLKTIVYNVAKGEHELETILVNYTADGDFIDHIIIAYDEIAEGQQVISSTIKDNRISKTYYWLDEENDVTEDFIIDNDGTIKPSSHLDSILQELNITQDDIYKDFFSSENVSETKQLVVIPKIARQTYNYLVLDAYILLVNAMTGTIEAKYIEENCWTSDAEKLSSIEATYQPYKISEQSETVGVTVYSFVDNPLNPYSSNRLTLFNREGDQLRPLLKDFEVYNKTEAYDEEGNGFYNETISNLITDASTITSSKFYNLEVTSRIEEVQYIFAEEQPAKHDVETELLIYKNGAYVNDSLQ
ncbi:hypothetical protein [Olleya sp. YS]|uniref:hypothetical protein n=1 Tax=Olleya sp. YS TaxID=3028318 RepID=UPI00243424EF|nr:hypothetical protein [Olleya sp. YS]WGD34532.1 hypothetical protein Ollyesu_12175 [Olleya sp. YS]